MNEKDFQIELIKLKHYFFHRLNKKGKTFDIMQIKNIFVDSTLKALDINISDKISSELSISKYQTVRNIENKNKDLFQ